jgi:16S rRNA (cytosine967-C5)-methyltransferase
MMTARDMAVLALCDRAGNVSAALDRLLDQNALGGADRGLANELAMGALRRRRTLETITRAFGREPNRRLPCNLEAILHVALYQLLYLERIPPFAAVDQAVEQAIDMHHRRRSGLVNALLRTVLREVSPPTPGRPQLAPNMLPVGRDSHRLFARPIFADPRDDLPTHLGQVFSLRDELVRRWQGGVGDPARLVELCEHTVQRPPLVLRVNRLRSDPRRVLADLEAQGKPALLHANGQSLVLAERAVVTELAVFEQGLVQPQDPTATEVGLAAAPAAGMTVLDFCAAPGTKTTHLAELMDNRGRIVAVDVSSQKIERIADNCRRLGITIVEPMLAEDLGKLELASFDLVLADVPCSNTGVLARRPEARWRFGQAALQQLADDQLHLAMAACEYVKPGGRLVYSTCSIEPEECSAVVKALAARKPRMRLLEERLTLPGGLDDPTQWRDGGYRAVLKRV